MFAFEASVLRSPSGNHFNVTYLQFSLIRNLCFVRWSLLSTMILVTLVMVIVWLIGVAVKIGS